MDIQKILEMREEGLSWRSIGKALALDGEDFHLVAERARSIYRTKMGRVDGKERVTSLANSVVAVEKKGTPFPTVVDETSLLREHGYDPQSWRIVDSTRTIRNGLPSTRIKVAPMTDRSLPDRQTLWESLKNDIPVAPPKDLTWQFEGDGTLIFPLYDVHFGKRHIMDGITLDHNDTRKKLMAVVGDVASRAFERGTSEIILPIGQDFCNFDTHIGTTTSGTPQDNSLPWHELFTQAFAMLCEIVEQLADISPLEVIYSEGNHDRMMSFMLVKALEQRYRHNKNICFDTSAYTRKYRLVKGTALIGFSHNSEEVDLSNTMQNEEDYLWGCSDTRYWLTGHLHHLRMEEKNGITLVRCPSITFNDEWHNRKGYVTSEQRMVAFYFTPNGLEDIWLMTGR